MANQERFVGIKDAFRGFAVAALVCTGISLVRLPFDAYFSGLGLFRVLGDGVIGVAATAAMAFVVISIVGLPLWILCRRFDLSKWWHFVLIGAFAGALLASRVNPNAYRSADYNRWVRGQETVRPALDAVMLLMWGLGSSTAFWAVAYRRRTAA